MARKAADQPPPSAKKKRSGGSRRSAPPSRQRPQLDPADRLVDARRVRARRRRRSSCSASSSGTLVYLRDRRRSRWPCSRPASSWAAGPSARRTGGSRASSVPAAPPWARCVAGWFHDEQPVAIEADQPGDMASAAMVFRAIGRPGRRAGRRRARRRGRQRLGREGAQAGQPGRARTCRCTLLRIGTGEGEVPVRKLVSKINRMRPALSKDEVARSTSGSTPSAACSCRCPRASTRPGPPGPQGHARSLRRHAAAGSREITQPNLRTVFASGHRRRSIDRSGEAHGRTCDDTSGLGQRSAGAARRGCPRRRHRQRGARRSRRTRVRAARGASSGRGRPSSSGRSTRRPHGGSRTGPHRCRERR